MFRRSGWLNTEQQPTVLGPQCNNSSEPAGEEAEMPGQSFTGEVAAVHILVYSITRIEWFDILAAF